MGVCLHISGILVNDGRGGFKDHLNRTGVKGSRKRRWGYERCVYKAPGGRRRPVQERGEPYDQ